MAAKRILFGGAGRARLLAGTRVLAGAVGPTLGPAGRTVLLERPMHGAPLVTKDGVTVAEEIEVEDTFANLGVQLVIEAAARTSSAAGDGTTTATLLAHAIYREGARLVAAGHDPIGLKRGIDLAVGRVVDALRGLSRPVRGAKDIAHVGAIGANGDASIGDLIARAMDKVGAEGVITLEQGTALETTLEVVEGAEVDCGFLSAYFITDPERLEARLEDALILFHEGKISRVEELVPLLEKVSSAGRALLIIGDVQGDALSMLVVNKLKGTLKVCAIAPPSYGDRRKEMLKDLAAQAGGRAITDEPGITLAQVTLQDLGRARRITVDREKATITGGAARKAELDARVKALRARYEATLSTFERQQLDERLRKLVGGACIIRVGATTAPELREKMARLEDALFATRAATEEGIVPGGGVALLRAAAAALDGGADLSVEAAAGGAAEAAAGIAIVRRACEEPCRRIAENAGREGAVVVQRLRARKGAHGYNAAADRFEDLAAAGIIDPTKVVRSALQNAASAATLLLTTGAFIVDAPRAAVDYPTIGGTADDALSLDPFLSRR